MISQYFIESLPFSLPDGELISEIARVSGNRNVENPLNMQTGKSPTLIRDLLIPKAFYFALSPNRAICLRFSEAHS
jgi:hypothetical protein